MSEAKKVAELAHDCVEELINDMLAGNHGDNYVLLGTLAAGSATIQVQLHVMQDENKFIDEVGAPLICHEAAKLEKVSAANLELMLIHQPNELLRGVVELQEKINRLTP